MRPLPTPGPGSPAEVRREEILGWRHFERFRFRPARQSFQGPAGHATRKALRDATFEELELEIAARWAHELREPRTLNVAEVIRLCGEMVERQQTRLLHAILWSLPRGDPGAEPMRQRLRDARARGLLREAAERREGEELMRQRMREARP